MNLTVNIPEDLLVALRAQAASQDRSVSRHIVSLIRKDVAVPVAAISGRRLSAKDQERADYQAKPFFERPFTKHLTGHRNYSKQFLESMTKEGVYAVYLAESWAGPDGTSNGARLQDYDERNEDMRLYNESTGQTNTTPKPQPPVMSEDFDEADNLFLED